MAVALIVAAGRGERLGSDRPKALVTVAGQPMLHWSVAALQRVEAVHQIVVALPADALDAAPPGTVAVAGGEARSQSVAAALGAAGAGDPVIVHDAARPLAGPELFEAAPLMFWIWVDRANHHPFDFCGDDHVCAGRGSTDRRARFQGDVKCCSGSRLEPGQSR